MKGAFAQVIDSGIDHIGNTLDNTGMRDWIYVLAYAAAVYLGYMSYTKIAPRALSFYSFLMDIFLVKATPESMKEQLGNVASGGEVNYSDPTAPNFKIDYNALALSMVAAYGLLKIDITDVASGVKAVASVVSKLPLVG